MEALDSNKACRYDKISTRMLKICGNSICKLLEIIYEECFNVGVLLLEWKNGNIVPIYRKGDKQYLKNYRPLSLLSIWGKIMEKFIFDKCSSFLLKTN